jgi:hypothetical protein
MKQLNMSMDKDMGYGGATNALGGQNVRWWTATYIDLLKV